MPFLTFGQSAGELFSKAPPDVDQALRARAAEYYDLQKDRKFRAAEALVCAADRDRYYDMEKRKYSKTELVKIVYEPGFKEAKVVYKVDTELMMMPQGRVPATVPITSLWRLEEGQWCFHIPDLSAVGTEIETPWGKQKITAGSGGSIPSFDPSKLPTNFSSDVKLSRQMVPLHADRPAQETVEIQNNVDGPVQLWLDARELPGLKLTLSEKDLPKGSKATLTIDWKPGPAAKAPASFSFRVIVEPFTKHLPVTLTFQPGAEGAGPKSAAAKPVN